MAENSGIGWTGSTWNPWTGCTKVSPGCAECYMFRWAARAGRDPEELRRSAERTFRFPLRLEKKAKVEGSRPLVFTCSLSDWFHKAADPFRAEAWEIVRACPTLTFQILTKRHGRIRHHLPEGWGEGWSNVWLGASVESGDQLARARELCRVPAAVRFLSIEPLLGSFDPAELRAVLRDGIGWVIVGGESGARDRVRPFVERDALAILEACRAEGVPCYMKQAGAVTITLEGEHREIPHAELEGAVRPELLSREYPR